MKTDRVLLVHLVANGDCLMATAVARQIKQDHPGCHLTWAISYKCKQVIEDNPFVDEIWPVEYRSDELPFEGVWHRTRALAEAKRARGDLDAVYYTQLFPDNRNSFDGTTRSSIFRSYPRPITVPIVPTLRLRPGEVARVDEFAAHHRLNTYRNVVLFECAPGSNQSSLSPELALAVARTVVDCRRDTAFVLSSARTIESGHPSIVDASTLSYRENAELSKHCTLLLGCSSGITWLLTSDWAKRLPTIQFLRKPADWFAFASVRYDHAHFGLDHAHVLETDVATQSAAADLVSRYLDQGSFAGLPSITFVPSADQLYNMCRMLGGQFAARRVLANFHARNPHVPVSDVAFLAFVAQYRLRARARDLLKRGRQLWASRRSL